MIDSEFEYTIFTLGGNHADAGASCAGLSTNTSVLKDGREQLPPPIYTKQVVFSITYIKEAVMTSHNKHGICCSRPFIAHICPSLFFLALSN